MKVNLISKTQGVGLYDSLTEDEIVTAIARHGTIKEDSGRLIRYLMNKLHWSPLQHISYGFKIETRRSISAQIFRHRSLNGQEWSLRYAEPIGFEEIEFREEHPINRQSSINPIGKVEIDNSGWNFIGNHTHDAYKAITKASHALVLIDEAYKDLIKAGVAKECARDILPLCTKTTIHITGTLRDLLGFLNVRHTDEAQKEVREIAYEIGRLIEKEIPKAMETIDWRKGYFM
jgi:thymidylate synthase (FAD)